MSGIEGIDMNIKIIAVGKVKEKFYVDNIKEFTKRMSKYCNLEIIETKEEKAPDNISNAEIEIIKTTEGKVILNKVKEQDFVVALAIEGEHVSSEQLAKKIEQLGVQGKSNIDFIIGGSFGLSKEVMNRSNYKLSFSKMTFPHQLMRVILLEQIYRSFRINRGEPYHK